MATNPNIIASFYVSDMILNLHLDVSFLSSGQGRSRAGGYLFLGSTPKDDREIQLNGNILIMCAILKLIAASAAEAELRALFLNAQEAIIICLTLLELGHPHPPTPVHVDNTTTAGIVNNTIKQQRLPATEMRYFWLLDQKNSRYFKVCLKPRVENMRNCPSKAHTGAIHTHVRPYCMHVKTLKEHYLELTNQAHGEGVSKHWGVRTTKEYHSPESQVTTS